MNPLISIIIPIYNVERYLSQCLDSIMAQTYINWECFLVDDGSRDFSGVICDEYATKDNRFKVLHKENGGVSSARNTALFYLKGEWLTFVDADDCLYPRAIEKFVNVVQSDNVELVQCSFNRVYKDGEKSDISLTKVSVKDYADSEKVLTNVWGTLFKSDIIKSKNILFDCRIRLGEDQIFLYDYMINIKNATRIEDILYFYRKNEKSALFNSRPEYEIASVKAFKSLKERNEIAGKRCDAMLLSWFISLVSNETVESNVIIDLFNDVKLSYCSSRKNIFEKFIFILLNINAAHAVNLFRCIRKIKKYVKS